jgi:hypothetical protein
MSVPPEPAATEEVVLEPVPDDGVGATVVGLVLWLLAGVACLILRDQLAQREAQWWALTCLAGLGVGLVMLWFTRRRARVYRAHRADGPAGPSSSNQG